VTGRWPAPAGRPARPARPAARTSGEPAGDPFRTLGLAASPDLTDDDVRAAWRRIATATHPDLADGGDLAAFAAAAAAYTTLRTRFGRGEALADLRAAVPADFAAGSLAGAAGRRIPAAGSAAGRAAGRALTAITALAAAPARLARQVRRGRPLRFALRVVAAASAGALAALAAGNQPATPALITGAATWLVLTARHDLAPPRS
jgi:hypothetical protein